MIATMLGIKELAPKGRSLLMKYSLLWAFITVLINASTTFYILHVLSFVSLAQLGFLIALSMAVQFLLDYPTGALADWIGHRWVLFIAYVTFAVSFGLLALSNSFEEFILVFLLRGFASAQHSEALSSWLHLNYRAIADEVDPTRYHYKKFVTRYKVVGSAGTSVSYVVAGFIAFMFSRPVLFAVQAGAFMLLAITCVFTVTNNDEAVDTLKTTRKSTYIHHLIGGAKIALTDGKIGFLVVSNVLWLVALAAWSNFFLHPLYYSYTGSDVGAGILRSVVWWIEVIVIFLFASFIAKMKPRLLPLMRLLQAVVFFGGFALLLSYRPLSLKNAELDVIAVTFVLGLMILNIFFTRVYNTLFSVIFLDNVPDSYRNAVYSLIPTLTLVGSIPLLLSFGDIIVVLGQSFSLVVLMILGICSAVLSYLGIASMKRESTYVGSDPSSIKEKKAGIAATSATSS